MSFDLAIAESERLGEQPVAWESVVGELVSGSLSNY